MFRSRFSLSSIFVFLLLAPISRAADWAIGVHGGAGGSGVLSLPLEEQQRYRDGLQEAIDLGAEILDEGGTSLEAVEAVVRKLEDNPLFNAGKGAVFNRRGGHELDASIMDGATQDGGAVAGVSTVKNPIELARLVMTETRHVLLGGSGAEEFANEMKVTRVENSYFSTDARKTQWNKRRALDSKKSASIRLLPPDPSQYGTVGCVALDKAGNLAAATSTGGLSNKQYGRIGDSPILGAGTFADNATCAVSGTGIGEQFIRHAVAAQISFVMRERKCSVQEAADFVTGNELREGDGGVICVAHDGSVAWSFNSPGMFRAVRDSDGRWQVLIGNE